MIEMLKNKVIGFIKNDWPIKLLSLVLAIFIWFLICEYADPDTDTLISNIPITAKYEDSVPEKAGLGIMSAIEQTVNVRVSGSRDSIALMDNNKIKATVDMSKVTRSGEYALPVKIDVSGQNIKVESQSVDTVRVRFDKNIVSNVKVDVEVIGNVAEGFIREEPTMLNNYVTVTGPETIVNTIALAKCVIKQDQFNETNTFNCSYEFLDRGGAVVEKTFLKTDVDTIDITITLSKQKTVPLSASLINSSGGRDSTFCTIKTVPETINITGSPDVLDAINFVDLGVIDVAEKIGDFETAVTVVLPNGVKNVDNVETVKVSVKFNDILTQTFKVNRIELLNAPKGKKADVLEKSIDIKVRGLSEDIKQLNAKDITVSVDLKDQPLSGTNKLTAYAVFPETLKVGTVGKYQLTVVVS